MSNLRAAEAITLELIAHAVRAGAYRVAAREFPAGAGVLLDAAAVRSAKAARAARELLHAGGDNR